MDELIDQIHKAQTAGLYYLAMFGTLALVDICGALAADNRWATPDKFKAWLSANLPQYAEDADLILGLRNSLLHQGRAYPHGGKRRMGFTLPGAPFAHQSTIQPADGEAMEWYDIPTFIAEVTDAADTWLRENNADPNVVKNLELFARYRAEGLWGYVWGSPVIA